MSESRTKAVEVEIPELSDLQLDAQLAQKLDSLCTAVRVTQAQISGLEKTKKAVMKDLKPLADSMSLPERVLGTGWDLRKTKGKSTFNLDRLKTTLLQGGWTMDQVNALVKRCTDPNTDTGWAVYGRSEE